MPLVMLKTTAVIPDDKKGQVLSSLSRLIADGTGKPESYVMATVEHAEGIMAGEPGPVAFADVRGIGGLSSDVNNKLSSLLCEYLEGELGIPADRTYVTFTDVPASSWGWKGGTFG